MNPRGRRLAQVALLLAPVLAPGLAQAQPRPVVGEVLIVLASDAPGLVDPTLADFPAFQAAPFNAYRSMVVLGRPSIALTPERPVEVLLPNGRTLSIVLVGTGPDGRYRVRLSINRPNQADYLPGVQVLLSPGDPFFIAGQSFRAGTLVIGVRLGAHAP